MNSWFRHEHVRFLWSNPQVNQLDADETSEMVTDFAERRHYVATTVEVQPMTLEDLTRREIERRRRLNQFAEQRVAQALQQSFSLEAVKQRYGYHAPQEEQITQQPGSAPGQ